jgi:hypothetical protein
MNQRNVLSKETVITIPEHMKPAPAPAPAQAPVIRTLVPEPEVEPEAEPELEGDGDGDGQPDTETEEGGVSTQKRKPRTKKVYPPSEEMLDNLIKSLCELRDVSRKMVSLARDTQKAIRRENREVNQTHKKEKVVESEVKPRGFALPSRVSNEMIDYLLNDAKITQIERMINGKPSLVMVERGCLLARNELTSALCKHFRSSQMRKNELDKRQIYLDPKTTRLFRIDLTKFANSGRLSPQGEPIVTYFDLQKYLAIHCGKSVMDQ